nr:IS3 family transposase [Caballeronia sp. ASUFL_F2_KS49]
MDTAGDAYDDAMCESFFGTLEAEFRSREHFATHEQTRRRIFSFLEGWYNVRRLHSSIGYCSPLEFENLSAKTKPHHPASCRTDGQRRGREKRPAARPWTIRNSARNGGRTTTNLQLQIFPSERVNLIAPLPQPFYDRVAPERQSENRCRHKRSISRDAFAGNVA